jgi:hypothetical protein
MGHLKIICISVCLAQFEKKDNEHEQQHCYHHDTKVNPEAATAIVEILMMGVRTPETC